MLLMLPVLNEKFLDKALCWLLCLYYL